MPWAWILGGSAVLGALLFARQAAAADEEQALPEGDRMTTDKQGGAVPRGIRNNNPFNLRPLPQGRMWSGQSGVDDGNYCTFVDAPAGLRAGFKNLMNQQKLHQLVTVRQIITKYAPSTENNTAAYIAAVSNEIGVDPDDVLDLVNSTNQLRAFGRAVIFHENGVQPYSDQQLGVAVRLALNLP